MYKIAIDAGHGSNTSGKRTPDGYREHWINVKCAYYSEIALKRCGFETLRVAWDDLNSKDDTDISLSTRQKQIKNSKCDASISWHANAFGTNFNEAQGVETFIHSTKAADSLRLAQAVQRNLIKGTSQKNRGVKKDSLAMCNCNAMGTKASVLAEIGFMTNKYESDLMKTDAFCKECAEEATKGFCEYFNVPYKKNGDNNSQPIEKPSNNSLNYKVGQTVTYSSCYKTSTDGIEKAITCSPHKTGTITKVLANGARNPYLINNGTCWLNDGDIRSVKNNGATVNNTSNEFQVKIVDDDLNIRSGAGSNYKIVGKITDHGIYTIIKTSGNWGFLKSKAGWICISSKYAKRL